MGALIWHQWGRLLAMTSGCYVLWAGTWAIFYRKFFWDMVGGTLGPSGLIPPPTAKFFISTIVDAPVFQSINIVNGLCTLALEWPLPGVEGTSIHRYIALRAVLYLWCAVIAMFPYQTIDAGLFYFITSLVFCRALIAGEIIPSPGGKGRISMA